MKTFKINNSMTNAEIAQLLKFIIEKLNIKFEDKEIPDTIKKHFK